MFATRRTLLRTLERERIAAAEERRQLIDTICVLAGQALAPTERDLWQQRITEARDDREPFDDDLVDADQLP